MIKRLERVLGRYPQAGVLVFAGVVAVCVLTTVQNVLDVVEKRDAVSMATAVLEQMQSRGSARALGGAAGVSVPAGSAFVEGVTVSVAGAALLQRVLQASVRHAGNVLSSQVDLGSPNAKGAKGILVTATFEIAPTSLQDLLYDIEAGMPFLFIDHLVIQAPTGSANVESGAKLRVLMSVSAQWQGGK